MPAINKKLLLFANLSLGLTLAVQALLHPLLDPQSRTIYLVVVVVYLNWTVFTWLAYTVAMKENRFAQASKSPQNLTGDRAGQHAKSLLDVTTMAYQLVILLVLVYLNVLIPMGVSDPPFIVWSIVLTIVLPLIIAFLYNMKLNRQADPKA